MTGRDTAEAAEHVAEPAEDVLIYSTLGMEAEPGNQFHYPLVSICGCGRLIGKCWPRDSWAHQEATQ